MEHDRSTLQQSDATGRGADSGEAPVPGLLRVLCAGSAMAEALPLDGELLLGRGAASLGTHQDPRMSRSHAQVRYDGRRFWVTDQGSQNGTFVDGAPLVAGAPREAQRVIRMGDSLFVPCADVGPVARRGVVRTRDFVRGPAMQRLLDQVARTAEHGFTLHVHGESGTGKEGVARAFHERGPRASGPFVAVNCAAIPQGLAERLLFGARRGAFSGADDAEGYLQAADGGTLFLDEVAELELAVQAKLLRALETGEVLPLGGSRPRKVDVRVCSAGNKDLRAQVASGRMREDLYFRLGRPEVGLPPMRRRPEEVPFLVERFLEELAPRLPVHVGFHEACLLRAWPGNVRELRVEVRSAAQEALLHEAPRLEARHLSPTAGAVFGPPLAEPQVASAATPGRAALQGKPLDEAERTRLETALRENGGNVAATARAMGLHRTQLRRLLERHGLSGPREG
ncbi:sigma 54-interacting transcriptional regulator [Corallococcus macrosporus]|uniref:Sigma-54-dependent Fis family transcriptional regulator n=1 Tax=Corallococcus macrosporus DSM 14697 TaxID=1189310 RepID=A0A250JZB5_9BACT|nr:sigma 54-interacting transcriptional regulator [Corallococcus macrosporus]ATB48980.1 sigma-54-dependent Fis family transcriptional regulator [Corallococcus macrosporus DSM 14697]